MQPPETPNKNRRPLSQKTIAIVRGITFLISALLLGVLFFHTAPEEIYDSPF